MGAMVEREEELTISIDGPYGIPPDLSQHERAVFVCGGIGVTPVHCMVGSLEDASFCHVVWVVQTIAEVRMLSGWLHHIREAGATVSLYVTRESSQDLREWDDLDIQHCPSSDIDIASELAKCAISEGPGNGLVFACGPEPLKQQAQNAALQQGL